MKRTITILAAALCLLTVTSCATMSMAELRPTGAIPSKLPVLEPQVDVYSVESAYGLANIEKVRTNIDVNVSTDASANHSTSYNDVSFSSGIVKRDRRVQDVVTLFTREVQNNISSPVCETRGTAYCRISAGDDNVFWPLTIISIFTGFIPNFLGLPYSISTTDIDVDVEIYDLNGNCVGVYNAIGKGRAVVAMYYGYTPTSASRKSAADAFKAAMTDIKAQIAADAERLDKALR